MNQYLTKKLKDVAKVFNGKTPSTAEQRLSGFPVLKIKDVNSKGKFSGAFGSYVDDGFASTFQEKHIQEGDILILNAAHNADYVGSKISLCSGRAVGALATGEWTIVRPYSHKMIPIFLYFYLLSPPGKVRIKSLVRGIHLYPSDVETMPVPGLPVAEQKRIVEILDEADQLQQLRAEVDRRTADLVPAIFHEMFGHSFVNEKNWPRKKVENVCELVRGSSPRPKGDPSYYGGPVPRLMIEDITRDGWVVTPQVDSLTLKGAKLSRPLKAGTVVMTVSGNVGVCAQLAVDACIHDGFVGFKNLDETLFDPFFFGTAIYLLKAESERVQAGAIFKNITTDDVKNLEVIAPPTALQHQFFARVTEIRTMQTAQASSRHRLDDLFQSLLHRAFQGDL